MKCLIAAAALLLITMVRLGAVVVTLGVDSQAIGIISSGSRVLSVNRADGFAVNQQIVIDGVAGLKLIVAVAADSVVLDSPADTTVMNAQIRVVVDNLDHSSVRVLWTTDTNTYASISYGISRGVYSYRTYENSVAQTIGKLSIGGLAPGTTYYLRINAKPNVGANTTGICSADSCGSKEITITTLPEGLTHPDLPQPSASFDPNPPDTSDYRVFPVPAFADGIKSGSIASGTSTLIVNSADGMLPNHWIFINGATCALIFIPEYMPQVGACQIRSVSGNTVTLTSNVAGAANNSAVSWALFTVQDFMDPAKPYHLGYGTVFEWAQGYKGRWYAVQASYGAFGLKLPGLPPDDNPNCSPHPCSLIDPAHRWIVLRTAAGPGLLPPAGVRTGPDWAPALGAIVAQNSNPTGNGGEVLWGGDGSYSLLPHHLRVENLELTYAADSRVSLTDASDPQPFATLVSFDGRSATIIPQSIVLDRVYIHGQGAPTRAMLGAQIGGKYNALLNSYVGQIDYWRPYRPLTLPCTASGNSLTVPQQTYQRNKLGPAIAMRETVTARVTSTGGYTGNFVVFLKSDGTIGINYSSPSAGTVSVSCANCTATSNSDVTTDVRTPHSWPANTVKYCSGTIASNVFTLSSPLYPDSVHATEGSIAVAIGDGAGPYTISNNFLEGYGINFFIDSSGLFAPIPSDMTFRRNYLFWNQDHRITSPTTNGYVYTVRNIWEIKRGHRWSVDGNIFEGQWARINQGSAILLSGRVIGNRSVPPSADGISDISITNNIIRNGIGSFYCQGGSLSTGGDPPLTKRILYSNNLTYGTDAFTYQDNPNTPFIGETIRMLLGCQDVTIRHNTAYYPVGPYPYLLLLDTLIFVEGLDVRDNIFYLNTANGAAGIAADTNSNTSYPQIPAGKQKSNYKETLDSISVRAAATVEPNYNFSNNIIIGGTSGNALQSQVDLTQAEMTSSFIPKFGALAAKQIFPVGATRIQRETTVALSNPVAADFSLADGSDIGADLRMSEAARGGIGNLQIVDIGSTGATATFIAPDPARSCWVAQGEPDARISTFVLSSVDNANDRSRTIQITGLTPGHQYVAMAFCDGASAQPKQPFRTNP